MKVPFSLAATIGGLLSSLAALGTDYYVDASGQYPGSYRTLTQAVLAVTGATATNRANVYVTPGKYVEQVSVSAPYVSVIGTGAAPHDVVIAFPGLPNVPPTTYGATVTVTATATAFMANNVTFENSTADQNRSQALAIRDSADLSIFYHCRFLGYQDTILADGLSRQYYLACFITGDTDYIYGNATCVFDKCLIQTTEAGHITAVNTQPTTATGLVFFDCTLAPGVDRNFPLDNGTLPPANNSTDLGRPWQWDRGSRASVVYIRTRMAPHIKTVGWDRWDSTGNTAYPNGNPDPDGNTRYAEFDTMDLHGKLLPLNTAPPTVSPNSTTADGSTRVGVPVGRYGWAKAMTAIQVANYTLDHIFGPASFWNVAGRQPDGFREAAASATGVSPALFQYVDPVFANRPLAWDPITQLQLLPRQ